MKKFLSVLLAIVVVAAVSVPTASADPGWYGRGNWVRHERFHRGGGCVGCEFVGGLILGGILGGVLAAPYYAAQPAPVYATPPPPACYTQAGYWQQVPYQDGPYTAYQNVWVPAQTVCR